jgi:hypothetical protein
MSDLGDSPNLACGYCPGCEPNRDPLGQILIVRWCPRHQPRCEGQDDGRTTLVRGALSGAGAASSDTNRAWCDLIHRGVRRRATEEPAARSGPAQPRGERP